MTSYNATAATSHRGDPTDDLTDTLIERLTPHHGSLGTLDGHLSITISYPAENLAQAIPTGLAVIGHALAGLDLAPTSLEVLPTDVFDRRYGFEPIPVLLSVTDAAAQLGVSPQAVRQRLDLGTLPGVKAGSTWVISQAVVEQEKARKGRSA